MLGDFYAMEMLQMIPTPALILVRSQMSVYGWAMPCHETANGYQNMLRDSISRVLRDVWWRAGIAAESISVFG